MPKLTLSVLALFLVTPALAHAGGNGGPCPPDSVRVGTACVDKYEASVWQIAPTKKSLIKKVQAGKATRDELEKGGAVLIGCELVPDAEANYPENFPGTGQWTPIAGSDPPSPGVYAASVAGVRPTACTSWFRASQACRLAGKRLVRNDEWQDAAAGTPDPGSADDGTSTCNTNGSALALTGSRSACRSNWGAFDLIGNAQEWVADWSTYNDECNAAWPPELGSDLACVGAPLQPTIPSALVRGGGFLDSEGAGAFNVQGNFDPYFADAGTGFRCAR